MTSLLLFSTSCNAWLQSSLTVRSFLF